MGHTVNSQCRACGNTFTVVAVGTRVMHPLGAQSVAQRRSKRARSQSCTTENKTEPEARGYRLPLRFTRTLSLIVIPLKSVQTPA
jgi:hypothetical protein